MPQYRTFDGNLLNDFCEDVQKQLGHPAMRRNMLLDRFLQDFCNIPEICAKTSGHYLIDEIKYSKTFHFDGTLVMILAPTDNPHYKLALKTSYFAGQWHIKEVQLKEYEHFEQYMGLP